MVFKWNIMEYLETYWGFFSDDDEEYGFVEYPGCCGATIICGFPYSFGPSTKADAKYMWSQDLDEYLRNNPNDKTKYKFPTDRALKNMIFKEIEKVCVFNKKHVYLLTLIDTQLWLFPVFKRMGFRKVSDRTVNGNSDNRLYVFIRDPLTPKGKKLTKGQFS